MGVVSNREVLKIGQISHPTLITTIRMLLVFWSIRRKLWCNSNKRMVVGRKKMILCSKSMVVGRKKVVGSLIFGVHIYLLFLKHSWLLKVLFSCPYTYSIKQETRILYSLEISYEVLINERWMLREEMCNGQWISLL